MSETVNSIDGTLPARQRLGVSRTSAVACIDVTVRFGAVTAVSSVSLDLPVGGVHALVGQNGAGKTTLARVIAGLQTHQSGSVWVNGIAIAAHDYRANRKAGVDMVHQHASLIPDLTVAEALELTASEPTRKVAYRRADLSQRWSAFLSERGVTVDVGSRVRNLSVELLQSIEIARSNPGPGGLLILDEPTSVLAPERVSALFERLRMITAEGVTVLVVLHKLAEVREVADTVTVLRQGKIALDPTPIDIVDDAELSEHIIGSGASSLMPSSPARTSGFIPSRMGLHGAVAQPADGDAPLRKVDLEVMGGEIVGIAGVEGNGQRTLVEVMAGLRPLHSGSFECLDCELSRWSVAQRRAFGLRIIPFDRNSEGVRGDLPLWQNVVGWRAEQFCVNPMLPLVSKRKMRAEAGRRLARFNVAYSDIDQPTNSLSGGNIQRLILARELPDARALVAAHPTRGLDISGIREVWDNLAQRSAAGCPVVVVSPDLDELLEHCNRLVVVRGGRVVGEHQYPFDRRAIGRQMTGASV